MLAKQRYRYDVPSYTGMVTGRYTHSTDWSRVINLHSAYHTYTGIGNEIFCGFLCVKIRPTAVDLSQDGYEL